MIVFFDEDRIEIIDNKPVKLYAKNLNKILNLISHTIMWNEPDKYGYYSINCFKFKNTHSRYKIYLRYLIRNFYIERNRYKVGEKSFGYRFTNSFKESAEIKRIFLKSDFKTRLEVNDDNTTNYINESTKERIRKDFLSAQIIYNLKEEQIPKSKDEWDRYINIGKWIKDNIELNKWSEKKRTFNWSSNRLYTNFVRLSSPIRLNNIKLNKEDLVEFDIKSSFPTMLAKYCIEIKPEIVNDYEFKKYCTDILDGKFYGKLAQGLNSIRNCNKPYTYYDFDKNRINKDARRVGRNDAKELFQIYLNGDYTKIAYLNYTQSEIRKFMELNYTLLHEIIKDLKDRNIKVYDVLVEMESRLIFKIIEELYSRYDDIRILTCHDAIYVPKSF